MRACAVASRGRGEGAVRARPGRAHPDPGEAAQGHSCGGVEEWGCTIEICMYGCKFVINMYVIYVCIYANLLVHVYV